MLGSVLAIRSLLLAIFILMAGAGFMATLLGLRLERSGAGSFLIGLVGTAYFAGLTLGALRAGRLVRRVGHIRAFAAFVSLLSASTLAYIIVGNAGLWLLLRLLDGVCVAGVYICLESWLNDRGETGSRGIILAAYMIALYGGQSAGQFLINADIVGPPTPFVIASLLISLALIPVALTSASSPAVGGEALLSLRALYAISPLGVIGAAATGVILGAFYGLGAVHFRRMGLDLRSVASLMSAVIFGGVVLQWPLGWLSDRLERRRVIVACFAGTAALAAAIAVIREPDWPLTIVAMLFGAFSFALYPLCVAHTNDHVSSEQRVGASGGLVLLYSAGAAVGPLAGAAAMPLAKPSGLFFFMAVCAAATLLFGFWRQIVRAPVPRRLQLPYLMLPRTTPVAATLDPLAAASEAHETEESR